MPPPAADGTGAPGAAAGHFADLAQQEHAARLGMWIFIASEALLFGALFGLYGAYRAAYPDAFREGVGHNPMWMGTLNTGLLLLSSGAAAIAENLLEHRRRRASLGLLAVVLALGTAFLAIKGVEYASHVREGILPGGAGPFFDEHPRAGLAMFFTLYYVMTGLHALHVIVGLAAMAWFAWWIASGRQRPEHAYRLGVATLYWHFVDMVWLFLWPMFYLMGGGGGS